MTRQYTIYNTLSRRKEYFQTIHPGMVGIYVCGPTVYGEPHLGHARPAVTYDVLVRLMKYLGYKVRYVRNITIRKIPSQIQRKLMYQACRLFRLLVTELLNGS